MGTEISNGVRSQSNTKSKSLAVERKKKMAKEVESGGVVTKEDERSTKKEGELRSQLRVSLI